MDAVIICVPTPLNEYHEPDLSYVTGTVESMPRTMSTRASSSSSRAPPIPAPPKTSSCRCSKMAIRHSLRVARATGNSAIHVAFSPEREDPGNDTVARHDIPKVIGGCGPAAVELAAAIYGSIFRRTVPVSSPAVAEMTKLLENIYRCVNIALVNELKQLCMRMGIDIHEVIDAATHQAVRLSGVLSRARAWAATASPSTPSIFPGRPRNTISAPDSSNWPAKSISRCPTSSSSSIADGAQSNNASPSRVQRSWSSAWPTSATSTICANRRRSPSSSCFAKRAPTSSYNDPYFPTVGRGRHYDLNMTNTPLDNLGQYDAVLIVTDHTSLRLPRHCRAVANGHRHPERHQGHRLSQNRALLRTLLTGAAPRAGQGLPCSTRARLFPGLLTMHCSQITPDGS